MAISTEGFRASVMPQYTPVDPRLVAFSPSNFTNGVLSAIDIQNARAKVAALQAANQEQAATTQARVAAQNAQNQGIATITPVQTQASLSTIPALANQQVSTANLATEKNAFETSQLPVVQDTQATLNLATNKAAPEQALAIAKQAEANVAIANDALAKAQVDTAARPYEVEAKVKLQRAQADQAAAAADLAHANANYVETQKAQIAQNAIDQKAEAARLQNEARVNAATGRIDANKVKAASDEVSKIGQIIKNFENEPLGFDSNGKPVNLLQYKNATRDETGEIRTKSNILYDITGGHYGTSAPVPLNSAAEAKLKIIDQLNKKMEKLLRDSINTGDVPLAPVPATNQPPVIPLPPQPTTSYKSPDEVKAAFQSGLIDRATATSILSSQFGFSK